MKVDINCDLGESFGAYRMGTDEEIMPFITSANIACGFHAGDPVVMRQTVKLALKHGVAIGAHPGFPDLVGFGRRPMELSIEEAYTSVLYQLGALSAFIQAEGGKLHHVKPHGALYNMAAKDKELAEAIVQAIADFDASLILYGLSGSELIKAGKEAGLKVAEEVFVDRTYQTDGSLTSRRDPQAFIATDEEAVQQALRMVQEGKVQAVTGETIDISAHTICIHGDGPHALIFASYIRKELENRGIIIQTIK
ncbi:5-oxoprolinase subunit PxpA [Bacillus sp. Hm123]|uniref:5-oxoprolinase subunit PxpA n=1 Tax=Bacillus sp. Hm123 TaxID=3450745 RepID=UPI003F43365D